MPFSATLDTSGATTDAVDTQANASCGAPATGNSVWYKFTAGPNNKNIFVDASASDYFAGVLVAKGTPGSLTTVSCGPLFVTAATTPGTTYYIMVFDAFGEGGGTLRLNIGAAPTIVMNVHRNALIDTHGVVHLTGTYRCTDARFVDVSGLLIEIVGRKVATGSFDNLGIPAARCDGKRHGWTGLVLPAKIRFAPGNAAAFINTTACGPVVCTLISQTSVVTLANTVAGTSGFARDASYRSRTIRRPSARSYGNARHPTTITWGH